MKYEPKSDFSGYKNKNIKVPKGENIVWARVLDCRYGLEVERTESHTGLFTVFDIETGDILAERETGISYNAVFGPNVYDAAAWDGIFLEEVDKYNAR